MFSRTCMYLLLALGALSGCRPEAQATFPDRRGGRGESCLVTNDCKEPLLCLGGECLDGSLSFKPSDKVCIQAQCINNTDCCPPQTIADQKQCATYKMRCKGGEKFACTEYYEYCDCTATCMNSACVQQTPSDPECKTDAECSASGGGAHCSKGRCVDCAVDAHCGTGYLCQKARCVLGCRHNEECGPLQKCDKLECVDRGCMNDRECQVLLDRRDAVCRAGECGVPCKNDATCVAYGHNELMTCHEGTCRFPGCSANSECAPTQSRSIGLCVTTQAADEFRNTAESL